MTEVCPIQVCTKYASLGGKEVCKPSWTLSPLCWMAGKQHFKQEKNKNFYVENKIRG